MMKAVFFDAVGTLIFLPLSVGCHYRKVAAHFGVVLRADELDKAFRLAWTAVPAPAAVEGPREEDDKGWWRVLVGHVLQQTLGEREAASLIERGYFDAVYAHFALPGVWQTFDDVADTLQNLRSRGLLLGVISNFDRRLYTILQALNLREYFDAVIVSSEVGINKPDRRIFQAALTALHIKESEAIHVGDDLEKDAGAADIGMQFYRVHRPEHGLHYLLQMIDKSTSL